MAEGISSAPHKLPLTPCIAFQRTCHLCELRCSFRAKVQLSSIRRIFAGKCEALDLISSPRHGRGPCNPTTWKVEARRSRVQGFPRLHETMSLIYMMKALYIPRGEMKGCKIIMPRMEAWCDYSGKAVA